MLSCGFELMALLKHYLKTWYINTCCFFISTFILTSSLTLNFTLTYIKFLFSILDHQFSQIFKDNSAYGVQFTEKYYALLLACFFWSIIRQFSASVLQGDAIFLSAVAISCLMVTLSIQQYTDDADRCISSLSLFPVALNRSHFISHYPIALLTVLGFLVFASQHL